MADRKVTYQIDFSINRQKLETLKRQLQKISKMTQATFASKSGLDISKDATVIQQRLKTLKDVASQTSAALTAAYNPRLDAVSVTKFTNSLGKNIHSLYDLQQEFYKAGTQGELAFQRVASQLSNSNKIMKESHTWLKKIGTTFLNSVRWTVSASIINSFTRSVQQAWGFTKNLQSSLNDIRVVTGKSADEMARFAIQANEAAKRLGKTTTDYTRANLIYRQQGLSDQEAAVKTDITLKAANVTGQSADKVSEELTAVWNGYKASASQAEIYVDRLTAVAAHSASNLQELSIGMSKVAAAAANLGVTEEQLAAQLSTIISVTRQAPETVGTALKTVYSRITDIKAGVEEDGTTLGMYSGKMAEMGINVLDAAGNLRDMGAVIEEVGTKWKTLTQEQQIYLAQTMAGQRQYSNLMALFENFDKYQDSLQVAQKSAGTLSKQQDIYMDSLQARTNQLTASLEKMYQSFMEPSSMKELISFVTHLTNAFGDFIKAIGGGAGALNLLGTALVVGVQGRMSQSISTFFANSRRVKMEKANLDALIGQQENIVKKNQAIVNDASTTDEEKAAAKRAISSAQREIKVLGFQRDNSGMVTEADIQAMRENNQARARLETQHAELEHRKAQAQRIRGEGSFEIIRAAQKIPGNETLSREEIMNSYQNDAGFRKQVQDKISESQDAASKTVKDITDFFNKENGGIQKIIQAQTDVNKAKEEAAEAEEGKKVATENSKKAEQTLMAVNLNDARVSFNAAKQRAEEIAGKKLSEIRDAQKFGEDIEKRQADVDQFLRGRGPKWSRQEYLSKVEEIKNKKEQFYKSFGLEFEERSRLREQKESIGLALRYARRGTQPRDLTNEVIQNLPKELQDAINSMREMKKKANELSKSFDEATKGEQKGGVKKVKGATSVIGITQDAARRAANDAKKEQNKAAGTAEKAIKKVNDQQGSLSVSKEKLTQMLTFVSKHYDEIEPRLGALSLSREQQTRLTDAYNTISQYNPENVKEGDQKTLGDAVALIENLYNYIRDKDQGEYQRFKGAMNTNFDQEVADNERQQKARKKAEEDVQKSIAREQRINTAMGYISSITRFSTGIAQLSNAIKTLASDSENAATKLGKLIPTLGFAMSGLINGIRGLTSPLTHKIRDAEQAGQKATATALKGVRAGVGALSVGLMTYSITTSIIQSVQENEKRKREEEIQQKIESSQKTLEEVESRKQLYKSLIELNQQYQKNEISVTQTKDKIQQLCQQYDLENVKIKQLIANYNNLGEAIKQARIEQAQRQIGASSTNLDANVTKLLDKQTAEKYKDNKYMYSFELGAEDVLDSEAKQLLNKYGYHILSDRTLSTGVIDRSDPKAVARAQKNLTDFLAQASYKYSNTSWYKKMSKAATFATEQRDAVIDAYNKFVQGYATETYLKQNKFLNINSVKDYSEAKKSYEDALLETFAKNGIFMSAEDRKNLIEKTLMKNDSDNFQKYANISDIYEHFQGIEEIENHLPQLEQFSNLTLEDVVNISPSVVSKWETLKTILEQISQLKIINQSSITGNISEAQEAYEQYLSILEKVKKGQKLTQKEFQALSSDLQKSFVASANGQYVLSEDQQAFQQKLMYETSGKFVKASNALQKKIQAAATSDKGYDKSLSGVKKKNDGSTEWRTESDRQKAERWKIISSKQAQIKGSSSSNSGHRANGNSVQVETLKNSTNAYFQDFFTDIINEYADYIDSEEDSKLLEKIKNTRITENTSQTVFNTLYDELMGKISARRKKETEIDYDQVNKQAEYLSKHGYKETIDALEKNGEQFTEESAKRISQIYLSLGTVNEEEANKQIKAYELSAHETQFLLDEDVNEQEAYKLQKALRDAAGESNNLSETLKDNVHGVKDLSQAILRFGNSLKNNINNIDDWKKALLEGNITVLADIKNAYADLLGVQEESFSNAFLKDEKNLQLLKTAYFGGEQGEIAYSILQSNIIQSILGSKTYTKEEINDILSYINTIRSEVNKEGLEIGAEIKDNTIKQLITILANKGFDEKLVEAIFQALNINVSIFRDDSTGKINIATGTLPTKTADYNTKFLLSGGDATAKAAQKKIVKEKQLTKLIENEVDLYHDVNIELNFIEKKLSKLQKLQKNLVGNELVKNLQAQNKQLDEQNKKLQEKSKIQEKDLYNQSSILRGYGITFNSDGSIANYEQAYNFALNDLNSVIYQIRDLESQMVGLSTDSQEYDNLNQQVNRLKTQENQKREFFDNLQKYISKYDSTRNDYYDNQDKMEENLRQQVELNLQAFQAKIKIKLDFSEAKREWDKFVAQTINRPDLLNPDNVKQKQNTVDLAEKEIKTGQEELKVRTEEFEKYNDEVNKMMADPNYKSSIFNSLSEGLKALQETEKAIQTIGTNTADALDTIKQAILDAYEDMDEVFTKYNAHFDFIKQQFSHDINLIELIEGPRGGRAKNNLYEQASQFNLQHIKSLKAEAEQWAEQYQTATDEATRELAHTKWQQTIKELNSVTTQSIQDLKAQYSNMINTIAQEMEDKLTNGQGFDYYSMEWDIIKNQSEMYLDTVNTAFAIKNTQFLYEKAINDAQGLKTQSQLRKVMDEQLKILKQKDKLTQYDVDRAQKVLDIEKAKIALEEAKNNKTSMRLKRDSQGNYSYEFIANQDEIEDAQNQLDKAKNDLYNFDLQTFYNNTDKAVAIYKDMVTKITEIQNDESLSEEQKIERIELIRKQAEENMTFYAQQNTDIRKNLAASAVDSLGDNFNQAEINYATMITGWDSETQGFVQRMATNPDSAKTTINDAVLSMQEATKTYSEQVGIYLEAAGTDYQTLKTEGIDPVVESESLLIIKLSDVIGKFNEISEKVLGWTSSLNLAATGFQPIIDKADEARKTVQKLYKTLSGEKETNNSGEDNPPSGTPVSSKTAPPPSNTVNWGRGLSANLAKGITGLPALTQGEQVEKQQEKEKIKVPYNKNQTEFAFSVNKKAKENRIDFKDDESYVGQKALSSEAFRDNFEITNIPNDDKDDPYAHYKGGLIQYEKKLLAPFSQQEIRDLAKNYGDWRNHSYLLSDARVINKLFHDRIEKYGVSNEIVKSFLSNSQAYGDGYYQLNEKAFYALHPNGIYEEYVNSLIQLDKKQQKAIQSVAKPAVPPVSFSAFDTGGYTGKWNSPEGKLAVLHEKQLILNKDDTENMLKMLEVSREYSSLLSSLVQNNVLNELNRITTQLNAPELEWKKEYNRYSQEMKRAVSQLDQQVKIEASFPAVNSKQEIEDALSNLVNLAAQRALKINKN